MKVKCLLSTIDEELRVKLGLGTWRPDYYGSITVGHEYIVLAMYYDPTSTTYHGGKPVVELKDDAGNLSAVPLFLCEITDPTPSKYWEIQYNENGILTMYPESFYQEFYHEDLSEGVPEVMEDFAKVCMRLEGEKS